MNIILKEALVLSPSMTSRKELKFTLKIKPEDYSIEAMGEVFDAFEKWNSVAVVMTPFQTQEIDKMPKLRQRLAILIKDYCEKEGYNENEELERLYLRNDITSRMDLTEEQLRKEVDKYEAWLLSY